MTEQPHRMSAEGSQEQDPESDQARSETRESRQRGASQAGSATRESGGRREDQADAGSELAEADDTDTEETGLKSIASLERLRDRVEVAAREMKRLREENRNLADRVQELESRPAVEPHGTFLSLDHDPEVLKRKISGFIEAIDSYLEKERKA